MLTEDELQALTRHAAAGEASDVAIFRAREPEDAENPGVLERWKLAKVVGETKRLRDQFADMARAAIRSGELEAENRAIREMRGLGASDAPALAIQVQRLEAEAKELRAAHKKEFDRVRELENARQAAAFMLGSPSTRRQTAVERAAWDALQAPDRAKTLPVVS